MNGKTMKGLKRVLASLLAVLLIASLFAGCGGAAEKGDENSKSEGQKVSSDTQQEEQAKDTQPEKKDYKIAWYAPAPHPYFEEVQDGVEGFEKEYGIEVVKQIGPDWKQPSQTQNVEALAAKGIKSFSIYPSDASGANGLYEELTERGIDVINFGAPTVLPTTAKFLVATDVKTAAKEATEKLIELMGKKGKILNVLEVLEDSNTVLRKEGVEEVVAKYPDVEIVQEISGMNSTEEAIQKIENALSANIGDVDGIIATGFTTSVAIAQVMSEYSTKEDAKEIHTIGIDTDPTVLKAIEEGYMDATLAQNPYGHGYLSCLLLKYLQDGWVPREGKYHVDSGTVIVTKDNIETFSDDIMKITEKIKNSLETEYLQKK